MFRPLLSLSPVCSDPAAARVGKPDGMNTGALGLNTEEGTVVVLFSSDGIVVSNTVVVEVIQKSFVLLLLFPTVRSLIVGIDGKCKNGKSMSHALELSDERERNRKVSSLA